MRSIKQTSLLLFIAACLPVYAVLGGLNAADAAGHKRHKKCHAAKHGHKHHRRCKRQRKYPKAKPVGPLPFMGQEPSPSLFGLDTGTYGSNHALFVRDIPTAQQIGAKWVHFAGGSIHWQPNGQVDYNTMDWEIKQAKHAGLGVVMSLGGAPAACSLQPRPKSTTTCPPTTDKDRAAYQTYLRKLLTHYHNVVDYYEAWVEPNHKSFWPSGPNPDQYAKLLEAEYPVFQQFNQQHGTHLQLLFGGPADFGIAPGSPGGTAVLPFLHATLDALGGRKVFDAIALHAYRYPTSTVGPDVSKWDYVGGKSYPQCTNGGVATHPWCQMNWTQELDSYESEFADHGYGQPPLWLTEFGWPGNPVGTNDSDNEHPDIMTQARYLTEAYADLQKLPYVQAAFWFNLRDYQPGYPNPDPEFFGHFGLYYNDYTPKPALAAWESLAKGTP